MTPEERIRTTEVMLVFDAANVPTKRLFKLAKEALARGARVRAVVPVTAHLEKLLDLRQAKHAAYDGRKVREALQDARVEILPLDVDAAEVAAARLHTWFPNNDEWQAAKRERLGLGGNANAPATIDWVTAAMCPEDAIVVTDDQGAEWGKCERMGSQELQDVLAKLPPPP